MGEKDSKEKNTGKATISRTERVIGGVGAAFLVVSSGGVILAESYAAGALVNAFLPPNTPAEVRINVVNFGRWLGAADGVKTIALTYLLGERIHRLLS